MTTPCLKTPLKIKSLEHLIEQIHHEVQIQGWKADLNHLDVSEVKSFKRLFAIKAHGLELFNGDISRWDMGNALTLQEMFCGSQFKGDVAQWDVSQVTDMKDLFAGTEFNGDLSKWNVSKVTCMQGMFAWSCFNQPIGNWDVSNVTNMAHMFMNNKCFNQPIHTWNVSLVERMSRMFAYSNFNQPLDPWNVESLLEAHEIFLLSQFNQPLSTWNVRSLEGADRMFKGTNFEHDLSQWELENLTNGFFMFNHSKVKAVPIPKKYEEREYVNFVGYIDYTPLFEQLVESGYEGIAQQDPSSHLLFEWIETQAKQKHLEQHLHSTPTVVSGAKKRL